MMKKLGFKSPVCYNSFEIVLVLENVLYYLSLAFITRTFITSM